MPIAKEKGLYIKFNNSLESAVTAGDSDKIKQIVINLISNGIKYSKTGGVNIAIEKTSDEEYRIIFKDEGIGIPQEKINFLFSKFQKTDPNKKGTMASTGLGLYISRLLAEKMKGSVRLESTEVGKGSVFALTMPVYRESRLPNKI
jgi:signal transduction histidine kinase